MKIDLDKVLGLAKKMYQDVKDGASYNIAYDYLKEFTPKLYDLILTKPDNFLEIIEFMVKKLKQDKLTEEKQSEDVGEFLAEQYVYPNIDMSKERGGGGSSSSKI